MELSTNLAIRGTFSIAMHSYILRDCSTSWEGYSESILIFTPATREID